MKSRAEGLVMRQKQNGKMTLTFVNIHACATQWNGFTKAQLQVIGVKWPPRQGWLHGLIGKTIPIETYERFRKARLTRVQLSKTTLQRYRELSKTTLQRYRERKERRLQTREGDRARRVAAKAEELMARRMRPHSWRRSRHANETPTLPNKPCVRCGRNERYLELDICEQCVTDISGYREAQQPPNLCTLTKILFTKRT
jgi:hypothetical protein